MNKVLRRMFGPKGREIAGKWKQLHIEKLQARTHTHTHTHTHTDFSVAQLLE
jgi:hypothetical protein